MKSQQRISKLTNPRHGTVATEFAMVLPIIFLFFFSMIEISRVLLLQHTADTAAYEGARCGMVPGATPEEARIAAEKLIRHAGLKSTTVTIAPDIITEETPLITVQVSIPTAANAWIFPFWFKDAKVTSEVTLFCERPAVIQLTGLPVLKSLKAKGNKAGKGSGV